MQPHGSPPATLHSTHDVLLLAAATDRDPAPALRAAAAAQVAGCSQCAALATELRSISIGLAALPQTRPAPHDMRLSPEQAARLGRGRAWRRLLRPFGEGGLPGLRPVAAALTTLGLAGVLLTAIPLGLGTMGSALSPTSGDSSAPGRASYSGAPAPGAAASPIYGESQQGPKDLTSQPPAYSSDGAGGLESSAAGPSQPRDSLFGPTRLATEDGDQRLSPQMIVSLGLLVTGLGLFTLLVLARRVA